MPHAGRCAERGALVVDVLELAPAAAASGGLGVGRDEAFAQVARVWAGDERVGRSKEADVARAHRGREVQQPRIHADDEPAVGENGGDAVERLSKRVRWTEGE